MMIYCSKLLKQQGNIIIYREIICIMKKRKIIRGNSHEQTFKIAG